MSSPVYLLFKCGVGSDRSLYGVFDSQEAAYNQISASGSLDNWSIIQTTPMISTGTEQNQAFGRAVGRHREVYGYRRTWQNNSGWGWISDENFPKDDPRVVEYLRLRDELGIRR